MFGYWLYTCLVTGSIHVSFIQPTIMQQAQKSANRNLRVEYFRHDRLGVSVLWVAYATRSTLKPVPTDIGR
jgi:hypothetical protein